VEYAHDDTFDMDVKIQRVANPFTVYGDPHSTAADASDWNRAFVTEMIPNAEFERRYKGADRSDWNGKESHEQQWFNEDATRIAEWWQREEVKRKIVLLSDGHVLDAGQYQENKAIFDAEGLSVQAEREAFGYRVTQRIVSGTEVLETTAWAGRYIPICPVYGNEVNIEGRRHFRSLIRDAKDPQRMFNFWRTSSTELVALAPKAPFIGRKGAFNSDRGRWQTANVKSHAFLEYDGQEMPQRQGFAGVPAGAIQEALNAADDMKAITGLYDASLGARSNETSGVAIRNRKIEGDTSTFHFIDNLSRGIRYGGRVQINRYRNRLNVFRNVVGIRITDCLRRGRSSSGALGTEATVDERRIDTRSIEGCYARNVSWKNASAEVNLFASLNARAHDDYAESVSTTSKFERTTLDESRS
jgi:hypothetical protein